MTRDESILLIPFPQTEYADDGIALHVSLTLHDRKITLAYQLDDPADTVVWPEQPPHSSAATLRQDELWKTTCMELFIKRSDDPEYWEFNFSPSGAWNAYHFTRYRQNMTAEKCISAIPVRQHSPTPGSRILQACVDLSATALFHADSPATTLYAGIAAVIQTKCGHCYYYAHTHAADTPDFHDPKSFCLSLPSDR